MLPGAQDMAVVESATGDVAAKASKSTATVSLSRPFADRKEPFRYRLRVSSGGAQHEFYDVYSFPPVLGEIDIHLLAEGNHLASYRKLGAHPLVHEGVEGVAFAVWAPNAQPGQRRRRLQRLGRPADADATTSAGSGSCSCPGLRPGHLYKYEILGADGQLLPLKADPQAERAERPPNTASIIADPSRHVWQDGRVDGGALGAQRSPSADLDL